jgi:putative hydrolase of the HAD superfamily
VTPAADNAAPPAVVVFDLGGVLVELDGLQPLLETAGIRDEDQFWARWLRSRWVREFERGRCTASEFAGGVVEEWGLDASAGEFLDAFRRWPRGLFPGAGELVARVRERAIAACLSNSNPLHWALFRGWGLDGWFDRVFLSHQLGVMKPDHEVFEHVADAFGGRGDQVLVLDDNIANVEGALGAGLRARQVRGVSGACSALVTEGLIDTQA